MKTIILVVVLSLAMNYKVTNAIALYCSFQTIFTDIGNFYDCTATILIETGDIEEVTTIYGTHETGKENEDVTSLTITSQNMGFFPKNIDEFFPNILSIELYNNSISSVSNAHLIQFPHLWYVGLSRNRISVLDSNLLSGLDSLKRVNLAVNEITSIESNLFAGLNTGTGIDLSNNTIRHVGHDLILPGNIEIVLRSNICVDAYFHTGRDDIEEIKFDLLIKCPPSISLIESSLENRPNFIKDLINRIAALEAIIENNKMEKKIED